ncbi:mechanosensitive ion channel family protein [Patescibacteria group bacterium]|nr:mechanosensitive ion channel family protein [Patescibacteria group bacterium]MBU2158893.1 mechanosensitive ion channel family protein [Patescibacteria group bacterium]
MNDIFTTLYAFSNEWIAEHGLRILFIVVLTFLIERFSGRLIARLVRRLVKQGAHSKEAEEKRENTLIQVLSGGVSILVWIIALMMLLSEFGIAIGPILAAAGVVGLALGFGGQYLIRDLISGIFILLENQYRTGDVVCFDTTCGLVEHLSLRMTTLRDLDGTVHHVPHGEIHTVSNLSKGFSRVNLNIGIGYSSKLDHVIEVVNRVGKELAEDPVWKTQILKAPEFLRVEEFADSAIIIKILGETLPIKQWDVAGELRMRLKIAFDAEGIEIPFPQRVTHAAK